MPCGTGCSRRRRPGTDLHQSAQSEYAAATNASGSAQGKWLTLPVVQPSPSQAVAYSYKRLVHALWDRLQPKAETGNRLTPERPK
jgi:hypothetical protein